MKKIIFTGGGTVGHVTLNLLLIPKFIQDGWEVHYIGDRHGIEHQQIQASGLDVKFHSIATGKLRRYFSWQNLLDVFKVGWGILQSLVLVAKIRPQVLFSKGGFVSVPPVIAARLLGKSVYIHESDLSMGLANKIAYKFATTMYTTFEQASHLSKAKHVGAVTKVGTAVASSHPALEAVKEKFDLQRPTLLFVGGSAGARVFNDLVTQHKAALTARYNIINLTGDEALNETAPYLYRLAYATDLYQPLMDLADVVITRGGSNTIFELLAMQKLHLIVPLGREASRGDQLENAAYFEEKGYAPTLLEPDLNLANLEKMVARLLSEATTYQYQMAQTKDIQSLDAFYERLLTDMSAVDEGRHG